MTAKVLAGKEVVATLRANLVSRVERLAGKGVRPQLAVVAVGADSSAQAYIGGMNKACDAVGVELQPHWLSAGSSQGELIGCLQKLNENPEVHGIIIMRPLPQGLNEGAVGEILAPGKDVDSFNPINAGKVMAGEQEGFPPATPKAVMEILHHYDISLKGRQAVVVGRSMVVGRPLAMLLLDRDATVTICHSQTRDLAETCRQGDIVLAAAGRPGLITPDMVQPGAVVIDVGINFLEGKMVGDVDFHGVSQLAGAITPVPGGVGTVTSTVVVKHVVEAAERTFG